MRHRRDPRRDMPARRALQPDLFAHLLAEDRRDRAVWRVLPEGTQRSLSDLLVRLLVEHGANVQRGGGGREH
jgi:hypothetical protein